MKRGCFLIALLTFRKPVIRQNVALCQAVEKL